MKEIRLLDLCCKAGGCSVGYKQAAEELGLKIKIVGVDIDPQPNYPFEFVKADASDFFMQEWQQFTHYHASPPCQEYTTSTVEFRLKGKKYKDNLTDIQLLFNASGMPSVIENVMPAPICGDVILRGDMFKLGVLRKRKFELVNWFMLNPVMPHKIGTVKAGDYAQVLGKGQLQVTGGAKFKIPGQNVTEVWSNAMGIDWMTKEEMAEAIPPAYTRFIGQYFFQHFHKNTLTMQEFISKVSEIRKLQKAFYKERSQTALMAAKSAEYTVDTMLESLGCPVDKKKAKQVKPTPPQMPKLFQ
jgi:DNA (cytosine-5)-methyltransferase 1